MIEYLGERQILHLHRSLLAATGGADGVRDRGMLQSALARPAASFAGQDLYVSLAEKAAALMHSLVSNHAFMDGNKRFAVAATELFLLANGRRLEADTDALEQLTLAAAAFQIGREEIRIWIEQHNPPGVNTRPGHGTHVEEPVAWPWLAAVIDYGRQSGGLDAILEVGLQDRSWR